MHLFAIYVGGFAQNSLIEVHDMRFIADQELAASQAKTYAKMTPQHMLDMLLVLFPYFNNEDKTFFLQEMHQAEPEKFEVVLGLLPKEYLNLKDSLGLSF